MTQKVNMSSPVLMNDSDMKVVTENSCHHVFQHNHKQIHSPQVCRGRKCIPHVAGWSARCANDLHCHLSDSILQIVITPPGKILQDFCGEQLWHLWRSVAYFGYINSAKLTASAAVQKKKKLLSTYLIWHQSDVFKQPNLTDQAGRRVCKYFHLSPTLSHSST